MVRVWIDDDARFEASHLLVGADGVPLCWNGWVQPVFTEKQRDAVIAHGVLNGWEGCGEGWYEVAPNEWTVDGWVWDFDEQSDRRFEVVTVHHDEVCSVAVLDWDYDECEMMEAVFDSEADAWEWADANYPAYFMDPRLPANDWKAWRFIVRPV